MVHLETLVAIRLSEPISIALVVEQQVYRQYVLLEYFLELVIQDKGEELIVFNASVKVLGVGDDIGEQAGYSVAGICGHARRRAGLECHLLPSLIALYL